MGWNWNCTHFSQCVSVGKFHTLILIVLLLLLEILRKTLYMLVNTFYLSVGQAAAQIWQTALLLNRRRRKNANANAANFLAKKNLWLLFKYLVVHLDNSSLIDLANTAIKAKQRERISFFFFFFKRLAHSLVSMLTNHSDCCWEGKRKLQKKKKNTTKSIHTKRCKKEKKKERTKAQCESRSRWQVHSSTFCAFSP